MRIEIWSDIACPWCFIGKRRFETALAGFAHKDEVEVEWRSYQLDPSLPEHFEGSETDYLGQAKGMPADQLQQMLEHVRTQADGEGLAYDFESLVVANSFTAHRFLHLAKSHGVMDAAKETLLSGHFEGGRNIGDHAYLAEVGQTLGIEPADTLRVLASDDYAAEVKADIAEARELGVTGVPFFVIDRKYGISGAQPSDAFAQVLDQVWAENEKLTVLSPAGTGAEAEYPEGAACGPEGCG